MTTTKSPTAEEIWKTLSEVDVNPHTLTREASGGRTLTYLSWAWAWGVMMEYYPDMKVEWATFKHTDEIERDVIIYPGGTCAVECTVTIGEVSRTMWLPVMSGFKYEAVQSPDARAISDTKMRCLTKCFALFGLGHYIYAGEDLPPGSPQKKAQDMAKRLREVGLEATNTYDITFTDTEKDEMREAIKTLDGDKLTELVEGIEGRIEEARA